MSNPPLYYCFMGKHFTVKFRESCQNCETWLVDKQRSFCSEQCRHASYRNKYKQRNALKQREKRLLEAEKPDPQKIQCLICSRWYTQVGSHVRQQHNLTAQEYKEQFELPLSRGVIPKWYREAKGLTTLENGTYKNLETGASFRYKKGDPRAKLNTGLKAKLGAKGFQDY